jgi:hypothetical protein
MSSGMGLLSGYKALLSGAPEQPALGPADAA